MQLGETLRLGPPVALQLPRPCLERRETLLRQRLQRPVHYQVDELLGSEEAAAVLAGVAVGTDRYLPVVVANRLLFQQVLVDRPKLLHGHVAVVDESPLSFQLRVAEVVHDGRDHRIGQADTLQQRRGFLREQAAVVGRKPDGFVATGR